MYVKFVYESGYCGGEIEEIMEFPDDVNEKIIEHKFELWYEEQKIDSGYWEVLFKEEAKDYEDY